MSPTLTMPCAALSLLVACTVLKSPAATDSGATTESRPPEDSDAGTDSGADHDSTPPADTGSPTDSTSPSDSTAPTDTGPEPDSATDSGSALDADADGYDVEADCEDTDASIHPGADERCDEIDNDCDGDIDERGAIDAPTWYRDYDGDSYGSPTISQASCTQPTHYVANDDDCDDADAEISPDATEVCDAADNDCDGTADEADATDALTCYTDADGDAYGDAVDGVACDCGSGTSATDGDCDDTDALVHPTAGEDGTDGVDNDCDGTTDEATLCPDWAGLDASTSWTYDYADPGFELYATTDFTGTREVVATADASTGAVSLSFSTSSYGRGYDGTTGRTEEATATLTCDADGMSLVSYESWAYEQDWFDYAAFEGEQNCSFDPPVLILPSALAAGDVWTTSGVSVACYLLDPAVGVDRTSTDTLDFSFAADSATVSGAWGDALSISGDSFDLDGFALELDFMADGAWVRGVGKVQDDKLDLTSYSAE